MIKHYARCTKCSWQGNKTDLTKIVHLRPWSYQLGCPLCGSPKLIAVERLMEDVEEIVAFKDSEGKIHTTEDEAIKANRSIDFEKWYKENDKILTGYGSRGTHNYASSPDVLEWLLSHREYLLSLLMNKGA